jgi:hypothetical protein
MELPGILGAVLTLLSPTGGLQMRRFIVATLSLVALLAARELRADSNCPGPSVPQSGQCVLLADAVLSDTMWIPSGTKLNCQGHRLMPVTAGALDDPRTTANEFQPSHPELAMFVRSAYDVKIQNCVIAGFDFGIIVAQSKTADAPPGAQQTKNKILGNTIDVRTNVIDVIKSDGVIISDNRLTYASERGRGIVLDFDSDDNEILNNTITGTGAASTGMVRQLPGGPLVTSIAIMDNAIHCLQSDKPLQNFVVSGVLVQVAASDGSSPDIEDSWRTDHNLIEGNDIVGLSPGSSCTFDPSTPCRTDADCGTGKGACLLKQNSGVGFNVRAADTIVRNNRFSGRRERGVSFGGTASSFTVAGWIPGTCKRDHSRICSVDSDCDIPGYDTHDRGPCNGEAPATFNGNTMRLTAEDNVLSGVYDTAALFANNTDHFTFRGNLVDGGASGIRINPTGINGLIERNVVSGAANALYLAFQSTFTQTIRLNDFTDYSVAIRTSNDFTVATDIAADKGNYWGLPCPGFGPGLVFFDNGLANPNVFDGKAYGEPVAGTPLPALPPPCP